jgi:hypothetical protein
MRDAGPDAYAGTLAILTGRVWVPKMAPGDVPPGEEIPVSGAVVYLSPTRPPAIPSGVYCERCQAAPWNAVFSGHDGSFSLEVPPGPYWLVIEKAQFRSEQQITLAPGPLALSAAQTTLPETMDPEHGLWIPRIALAAGTHDTIEDLLGKIGLGAVDEDYRYTATNGNIHVYDNGHPTVETRGTALDLLWDIDRMRKYHIILFPCSDETMPMLDTARVQENLRRYVMEGGKIYVTDLAGKITDTVFPPQITLGSFHADTVGTYDPADPTVGEVTTAGTAHGTNWSSPDGEVLDPDLDAWLGLQHGPTPLNPNTVAYLPDQLDILGNWNFISALTPVLLGVDGSGTPVYDTPKPWVIGGGATRDGVKHPMTVTFEPTGCGRVMYSTYHTTGAPHPGLYPQERILLYLILELGMCQSHIEVE